MDYDLSACKNLAEAMVSQRAQRAHNAFDKTRFRNFAVNIFNHLDESKAQQWSTQYVKDAFKAHVHRYERLGTYISPEQERADVLVVYLTMESKLERARTAIRNFVADHLKKRDEKDASLVAFVSPTEKQWRHFQIFIFIDGIEDIILRFLLIYQRDLQSEKQITT